MPPKSPFDRPEVLSRRGGPVKEPLSRERIIDEALALLERGGLEGMSLRKVASALDTGPASLYAYVGDGKGLQALVLDRALGAVDLTGAKKRAWRERLKAVLGSYITVLLAKPGLAQLAISGPAVGPNALRIIDTLLGLLAEGGVPHSRSGWAVDLLMLYGTGIAVEQSHGHDPTADDGPIARAIGGASAADYPHLDAARADLLGGDGADRFSWAIDVLLTGMIQCPLPRTRAR